MKKGIKLFMIVALLFIGCVERKKHVAVHSYKTQDISYDNDLLSDAFYYVIESGNDCYYATSPSTITNFSNVSWTNSTALKSELMQNKIQELEERLVETEELPNDIQADVNTNPGDFETESESDSSNDGGSDAGGDGGGDGGD